MMKPFKKILVGVFIIGLWLLNLFNFTKEESQDTAENDSHGIKDPEDEAPKYAYINNQG